MSEITKYLAKTLTKYQGTFEEKTLGDILFDDTIQIQMGDKRLNSIAALTYNTVQCNNIFNLLVKALNPEEFPWKTLYKALMALHTIVLYGSEIAVDRAVNSSRLVLRLRDYNSALVSKTPFSKGGTDYGAPVRMQASQLLNIIETDGGIRQARSAARQGQESLVPMGTDTLLDLDLAPPPPNLMFGQGVQKSIGAGYDLSAVPGMYENRPERYFDNINDKRRPGMTGDHQFTREAMNPDSLLDLAFGEAADNSHLPPAEYLPALEKQRELEALLRQQQEQLEMLRQLSQQQPLYHYHPGGSSAGPQYSSPTGPQPFGQPVPGPFDFLGMGTAPPIPAHGPFSSDPSDGQKHSMPHYQYHPGGVSAGLQYGSPTGPQAHSQPAPAGAFDMMTHGPPTNSHNKQSEPSLLGYSGHNEDRSGMIGGGHGAPSSGYPSIPHPMGAHHPPAVGQPMGPGWGTPYGSGGFPTGPMAMYGTQTGPSGLPLGSGTGGQYGSYGMGPSSGNAYNQFGK